MKLRPLADRLIVKPVSATEVSRAGIIVPETVEKKPEMGEVIAVGPGRMLENGTRVPVAAKVGDKVVFKKYAPDEVKIDGVEYLVLSESDIMAVVE
jgi:chaperonin GroES